MTTLLTILDWGLLERVYDNIIINFHRRGGRIGKQRRGCDKINTNLFRGFPKGGGGVMTL